MAFSQFVHLHTHSQYSLLDGACRLDDVIALAKHYRMPALAITDHGNLFGAVEFYKAAKKAGIKPIIGCEAYVAGGSRHDKKPSTVYPDGGFHLILLAKNLTGYHNLMKLSSAAYLEGFYHRPRMDKELLRQHSEGLIATSACMKGEINWNLLKGDTQAAVTAAAEYLEIFGQGNFYLEIQDHGIDKERILIPKVVAIAKQTGIPLIATNDCHYLKKEHASAHDCLLCIQTGRLIEDEDRMRYNSAEIYFKSTDEMERTFGDHTQALQNTMHIAESCHLELELGRLLLPSFPIPIRFADADVYLRDLCEQGLSERYDTVTEKHRERLDYELGVIKTMGYAGYFLIVSDFCDYARRQGIMVGPGRGSAAGSLVSYVLRITNVDPIAFELLFERFLNPERVSMPDIDIDFAHKRRDEIIKYVIEKYGKENVCQIISFGTLGAKGVIKDVGRAMNMPYGEVDKITKMVPNVVDISLTDALAQSPELETLRKNDQRVAKLIEYSLVLEGLARHTSVHAAGVVIAPSALTNYIPLFKDSNEAITTQFDMRMVEEVGLLKMDFLGLKTLTVIEDTLALIKQDNPDSSIDIDALPLDEPDVFRLFSRGETIGIFQFESPGMREYLRRLEPETFNDIAVMNALYRPGPLDYSDPGNGNNMIDIYIERKKGQGDTDFLHPALESILQPTHGVIVFQEQVLSIANQLAGYSLGEADLLRKAMGKKDAELMAKQKTEFTARCVARGVDNDTAAEVFSRIETFARYGFNKAHSTCYALIAYQTAWLKAKYPAHFMAAILTSEINDRDRIYILLDECRRMGVTVLPPDVNESAFDFSVNEGTIRFGLQAVKNVGEMTARAIMQNRKVAGPFETMGDLVSRIEPRLLNRRSLESLVAAGACDSLAGNRAQKYAAVELMLDYGAKVQQKSDSHDLFAETGSISRSSPRLPAIEPWNLHERLSKEKEVLGFYLTGHPLDRYRDELPLFTTTNTEGLAQIQDGKEATLGGIVVSVKQKLDKRGNTMAFVTLEDYAGAVELIVFADCYGKNKEVVEVDRMLLVTGKVSTREGEAPKLVVNEILPLEKLTEKYNCQLVIKLGADCTESMIERTLSSLEQHRGTAPVLFAARENGSEVYVRARKYSVALDFSLLNSLKELLGDSAAFVRPLGK